MVENLLTNAGDGGSTPGSGRSPGGGNGNPLQCSCLEDPWTEEAGGGNPWSRRVARDLATEEQHQENLGRARVEGRRLASQKEALRTQCRDRVSVMA